MLYIKAKRFLGQFLLKTIPTLVLRGLHDYLAEDTHQKTSQKCDQLTAAGERKVYDLVNCGPKNRFMVGNLIAHNCQYGAGPGKIWYTLQAGGETIHRDEVADIHADWQRLFAGTKRFAEKLERRWNANGGWIYNLLLRPMAVDRSKLKDLVSRFAQSSGHGVLLKWLCHINRLRKERGVDMHPYISDRHDEVIFSAPTEQAEQAKAVLEDALQATNEELKSVMPIPVRGTVEIADTLAGIKFGE